jgi:hypothetical protein
MNRADWAWLMASVLLGLFFALLAALSETGTSRPAHEKEITIMTTGDVSKIIQAVHSSAPDSFTMLSSSSGPDHFQIFFDAIFGAVFSTVMISYLFRILVKICQRILGVKPSSVDEASLPIN